MKKALAVVVSLSLAVLGSALLLAQEMPPLPKPGPEHEILKGDVGVWDASVEFFMAPGAPPAVSKGVETNRLLGGLWFVSEFKSEMMGQPFEGVGTMGYDPGKKKYVGTWVDSMSVGYSTVEGTYDPATKTLIAWMVGPDLAGQTTKTKQTTEWKDADNRVFTMYAPDGQTVVMRITYKRRK
jgi:hypothetical protein